ncbi:MAG: hypothetical protein GF317_19220 [Candidatus Lokiarchaeota archaeon]|nr:hypothetical protein [Candidatus Lokiarchaeota archaeon]
MPFIFPIYSYNKGDKHHGGYEVSDATKLSKGIWRLTFNIADIIPESWIPEKDIDYNENPKKLPADKVMGKTVELLKLQSSPSKKKITVILNIKENPIPIGILAGGVLALGIIGGVILSLDKVEKILQLPSTYILIGLGLIATFKFGGFK